MTTLRIATFNLENLDDRAGDDPTLAERIAVLRPQLARLRADVLCLQEVNGQESDGQPRRLLALQELLSSTPYADFHIVSTRKADGSEVYDERNLVVVSRFPIAETRQLRNDLIPAPRYRAQTARPEPAEASEVRWERPILYTRLDLPDGRPLHVVQLHLKSRIPTNVEGQRLTSFKWRSAAGWAEGYFLSSMKRVGQALETRVFIDTLFDADPDARIVCAGDFNADFGDVPVEAIAGAVENTGNGALAPRVVLPCERTVPEPSRYSLFHHGQPNMLDHLMCSRNMIAFYRGTEIHNELLHDESIAFATDVKYPESDHAPVVAEFELG